jgi:hypothetical protein
MKPENIEIIRTALTKALAAQVERTFSVARVKGYKFPEAACDVGLTIVRATPEATHIKVRIDDITTEATVRQTSAADDVLKVVDGLVDTWLVRHADAPH